MGSATDFLTAKRKTESVQNQASNSQMMQLCVSVVQQFKDITRKQIAFHLTFFVLGLVAFIAVGFSFSYLSKSSVLAFLVAACCLSVFSYLILFFYFQTKKSEQLLQLKEDYISSISERISFREGTLEYYQSIATAMEFLYSQLKFSIDYPRLLKRSETLSRLFAKFRIWSEWKDWLNIKELFLHALIDHHVQAIKIEPLNVEVHSALAQSYRMLAEAYKEPIRYALDWKKHQELSQQIKLKCQEALHKALEEWRILEDLVPNDPNILAQLAELFHELKMYPQEIREYEKILSLVPEDQEVQLRLGVLYFQNGQTAQALKLYQSLRNSSITKAEKLISHYSSYSTSS